MFWLELLSERDWFYKAFDIGSQDPWKKVFLDLTIRILQEKQMLSFYTSQHASTSPLLMKQYSIWLSNEVFDFKSIKTNDITDFIVMPLSVSCSRQIIPSKFFFGYRYQRWDLGPSEVAQSFLHLPILKPWATGASWLWGGGHQWLIANHPPTPTHVLLAHRLCLKHSRIQVTQLHSFETLPRTCRSLCWSLRMASANKPRSWLDWSSCPLKRTGIIR